MGKSRRKVRVEDESGWIFNRMACDYDARPAYPATLTDAIVQATSLVGLRVIDLGAGIGHLALPLAERGLDVLAVEPARHMLEQLKLGAARRNVRLRCLHAAAEALPFDEPTFDCALIADALHFLDAERVAEQLRRALTAGAALIVVTNTHTPTPFMREVQKCVTQSADRRRRDVAQAIRHLASLVGVQWIEDRLIYDENPLDLESLVRVLRSVSFIGPAMERARFDTLRDRVAAIPYPRVWARTFGLRIGYRKVGSGSNAHSSCLR